VDPAKGHTTGSGSTGVLAASRRAFGGNVIPHPAPPTFLWFLWEAYKDRTLLFLSGAALVSLSIGVYEDVKGGTLHHWIEGAAILLAVCLVVLVGAVNDWQKDRQFRALSAKAEDRLVRVLRDGLKQQVSIFELVVGDVVLLDPGDVLPADGLLLESHGLVCDESGATGESDQVKKDPAKDPFFISGTKVLDVR
jgi:Ca2+-transporting ATPase